MFNMLALNQKSNIALQLLYMDNYQTQQKKIVRFQSSEDKKEQLLTLSQQQEEAFLKKYFYQRYFKKWISYIEEQRIQTVKKIRKNNMLKDKQLQQHQQEVIMQKRTKEISKNIIQNQIKQNSQNSRSQLRHQHNSQDQQPEIQQQEIKYGMAIKKHQKIIKIKVIQSLMKYNIKTKLFRNLIASSYCQYLNQKYFDIILQYKNKRFSERVTKIQNIRKKVILIKWRNVHNNNLSKKNEKNNQSKTNMSNTFQVGIETQKKSTSFPNRNQILQNNQKGNFTQICFGRFQQKEEPKKNLGLELSRNSNISSLSNQSQFLSKRKFKPILQAPSFPDLKTINQSHNQHQNLAKNSGKSLSPIHKKLYKDSQQKQEQFDNIYEQSLNRNNGKQKQSQKKSTYSPVNSSYQKAEQFLDLESDVQKKQSILGLLTKLKLIQLKIMNQSSQFKSSYGQQKLSELSNIRNQQKQYDSSSNFRLFQAYMLNSRRTLTKLKQLKV